MCVSRRTEQKRSVHEWLLGPAGLVVHGGDGRRLSGVVVRRLEGDIGEASPNPTVCHIFFLGGVVGLSLIHI